MNLGYKIAGFCLCIVLSFGICGCVSLSRGSASMEKPPLEVAAMLKFANIPVPAGFNFLTNDSFAFQNDAFRVALLKYTGKGNIEEVVSFYKEQMPLYRWNSVDIVEYGQKTLNFQRPDEACTITIDSKGSKSTITISLAPRSVSIQEAVK